VCPEPEAPRAPREGGDPTKVALWDLMQAVAHQLDMAADLTDQGDPPTADDLRAWAALLRREG
jgi:hypothetical protein